MVIYKGKVTGPIVHILRDSIADSFALSVGNDEGFMFFDELLRKNWNVIVIKNSEDSDKCHIFFESTEKYGNRQLKNISIGSSNDAINKKLEPIDCRLLKGVKLKKLQDENEIEDVMAILNTVSKEFYISKIDFSQNFQYHC